MKTRFMPPFLPILLMAFLLSSGCQSRFTNKRENTLSTVTAKCGEIEKSKVSTEENGTYDIHAYLTEEYASRIADALANEEMRDDHFNAPDPILGLLNNYIKLYYRKISPEEFAKRMLREPEAPNVFWGLDEIVGYFPSLDSQWHDKFHSDPFFMMMDSLLDAIGCDTPLCMELFAKIALTSDGFYGEYMEDETIKMLLMKPELILSCESLLQRMTPFLVRGLQTCDTKDRERVVLLYSTFHHSKYAKKIGQWLREKPIS